MDLLVYFFDVFPFEGFAQADELIYETAQGPDVGFAVVGFSHENFGAGVVERSRSGLGEAVGDGADVEVCNFGYSVFEDEYIFGLV
jgi:hypothetical protein